MKLKRLVGSMVVLGLVSTGVIAAPQTPEDTTKATQDTTVTPEDKAAKDAFWESVIDRNQDNAYLVTNLHNGDIKLSGLAKISAKTGANRHDIDLTKTDLSEDAVALYMDTRVNDFTTLHLALAYGLNNTIEHLNGSKYTDVAKAKKELYFPEAYAKMTYNNFFAKVGQQYLNFGSTSHHSISTPVTQLLSQTNQVAVTAGVQDLGGFYTDLSIYKGAHKADNESADSSNSATNGYVAEAGYALHNDNYSLNVYADYISNMADVDALNFRFSDAIGDGNLQATSKNIPGIAVHGGFTMGPFEILADYVTALKYSDATDYQFNKSPAEPKAYSVEASYNFMPKQTVTLGFQGTKQAQGLNPYEVDTHMIPKRRLLAAYTYQLSDHVSLAGEFTHDKDYNSKTARLFSQPVIVGVGKTNNTLLAKLKVVF